LRIKESRQVMLFSRKLKVYFIYAQKLEVDLCTLYKFHWMSGTVNVDFEAGRIP